MSRIRRGSDALDDEPTELSGGSGGASMVAATFIKYAAFVIIVLIVAHVVLRIVGMLQGTVF